MRARAAALVCALVLGAQEQVFRFETTSRLVVLNVTVKDAGGAPLDKLKKEDFEVHEDGRLQKLSVFELQRIEEGDPGVPLPAALPPAPAPGAPAAAPKTAITPSTPGQVRFRDRRLIVLFFDLSSMAPEEQFRAKKGAIEFVNTKMTSSDAVAVMTFASSLKTLQDFTGDREQLVAAIETIRTGEASELAEEAGTGSEDDPDTGAAFAADETEFNVFNTDRKLSALQTAVGMLSSLPERKAFVYFSSGAGKTGVENQAQLRTTINSAQKANVAFYPVDAKGLAAEAPLGDARQGGRSGSAAFSGAAQRQRRDRALDQQETLYTLAADTGGKALLDSNDLSFGIVQAQRDFASYYILGYYTTNTAEDGKYRRVSVRIPSQPKARLDYRPGYYASKQFKDFSSTDRERQLEEALLLGNPITDLPLAVEVNFFRRARERYIVPVAVKIPGSEVELSRKKGAERTRLDFIGQIRDSRGAMAGTVRDFIEIKLAGTTAEEWKKRSLQYDTAFTLAPGRYSLKFLVRENATGKMGTFETPVEIPNIDAEENYVRMSTVVWSGQREEIRAAVGQADLDRKAVRQHPLVRDGAKLIPSITKVFRHGQSLRVFFESYMPDKPAEPARLAASVSFFRRGVKVFESDAFRAAGGEKASFLPVELEIPLASLSPGRYLCQLNVIDESRRKFAFRRTPLVILP